MRLLHDLQHERKVLFGDRAMAHSLRPTFLTEAMYTAVQDTVYLLRQAILRVSEAFFEDGRETARRYPEVYAQLKRFYRQDPASR